MEELNYHKLLNLKKRFLNYDCENSKKILSVIDECIVIEKAKSEEKDKERRIHYRYEMITCDLCGKEMLRKHFYQHKKVIHFNWNK